MCLCGGSLGCMPSAVRHWAMRPHVLRNERRFALRVGRLSLACSPCSAAPASRLRFVAQPEFESAPAARQRKQRTRPPSRRQARRYRQHKQTCLPKYPSSFSRLSRRPGLQLGDVDVRSLSGNSGKDCTAFKKGRENQACRQRSRDKGRWRSGADGSS